MIKMVLDNGKRVGIISGNTFYKSIQGNKHLLRQPPAIANDVSLLDRVEKAGATQIIVTDKDDGKKYISSIANIRKNGFTFDRGHGKQIGLVLERWSISPLSQKSLI